MCDTLLTFHFPEAKQHNFVLKFHTHSVKWPQIPKEVKPHSPFKKNVSRTTTSPVIRGHRTQGLNSSTRQTGQIHVINSQAAAHNSWLVRSSPHASGISRNNPHVRNIVKNISNNIRGKYSQKLLDDAK